jgi:hypothetical protein
MKSSHFDLQNSHLESCGSFPRFIRMVSAINFLILVAASFFLLSCGKEDTSLSTTQNPGDLKATGVTVTPLIAGQNYNAGTVSATFDTWLNTLTITYSTANTNWILLETHLDVQSSPENFPQNKKGNPIPGHFEYGATLSGKTEWTQVIDMSSIEGYVVGYPLYIAAHAVVKNNFGKRETGWGEGLPFPGNNWSMYFSCLPGNPPT